MIEINNEIVEIKRFPDGTLNLKGNSKLVDTDEIIISWHYENDAEFMAVAFLTKYYQAHGCEVTLYMPYVPNARMDRVQLPSDIFSMKYFGELINSLDFKEVWICDPHSSVAYANMNRVHLVNYSDWTEDVVHSVINMEMGNHPIIFFPDEGAVKHYSNDFPGLDKAFAVKHRDWNTGTIEDMTVISLTGSDIKGRPVIIRDDICSSGGTAYHAAKKLKEMGSGNIYLMVTHCEDNIHKGKFGDNELNLLATGLITKVFTTDSIYRLHPSPMIDVSFFDLEDEDNEDNYDEYECVGRDCCDCTDRKCEYI